MTQREQLPSSHPPPPSYPPWPLSPSRPDPSSSRVQCSAGYKALALDFELWAHAQLPTVTLFLQHFEALLSASQYRRFNQLRTFQKSNVVRKLLYALRSGQYSPAAVPLAVDTLRLTLTSRWSAEDGIKPVFSYLVSALCQRGSTQTAFSGSVSADIRPHIALSRPHGAYAGAVPRCAHPHNARGPPHQR